MTAHIPTVFISYSWDSEDHKDWVLNLANQLVENGVDVILDQYDLKVGKELTYFMEKGISADKILVILTPGYKGKADNRKSGVGYEYSMLTQEYFEKENDNTKIIPILRSGDKNSSCPVYVKGRVYHDMKDDKLFDQRLFELIKLILDKPLAQKPTLGTLPNFEKKPVPELDKKILDLQEKEKFYAKKNLVIHSHEGSQMFAKEFFAIIDEISQLAENYSENFNFKLSVKKDQFHITVTSGNFSCVVSRVIDMSSSTPDSIIKLEFFQGPVDFNSMHFRNRLPVIEQGYRKYVFDLDKSFEPIFRFMEDVGGAYNSHELAKMAIKYIVENEIELREKKLNK